MFDKQKMKTYRINNKMTQKKLGLLCNPPISESTIRKYELGLLNPKFETVTKIANALHVPISALWDFDSIDNLVNTDVPKDEANQELLPPNPSGADEQPLLADYRKLNLLGREEAKKRVNELTEIKKYTEFHKE